MKSYRKFIRRDVARHVCTFIVAAMFIFPACSDYLDIVPDNTLTLDDVFAVKKDAYNALAKLYYYLPPDPSMHYTSWMLGDEYLPPLDQVAPNYLFYIQAMKGLNSATRPLMSHWSGTPTNNNVSVPSLYQAINSIYVFLSNIDKVHDMDATEKKDWKAQAKFLLGYYNFILVRQTGPIVLKKSETTPTASDDELYPHRATIDECFNFILQCMNEAIPDLEEERVGADLGQIDRIGAAAIKARVLFFRASRFYNGNSEFYSTFTNHNGEHFFPQTYDKEKWKDAIDAIDKAISLATDNGKGLYTTTRSPYTYDREDFVKQPARMKTLYDLSLLFPDPWNKELLWGQSQYLFPWDLGNYMFTLTGSVNIILNNAPEYAPIPGSNYGAGEGAWNWVGGTYNVMERFYTKNGLPIDDDLTFNQSTMFNLTTTPVDGTLAYEEVRGYLQPNAETLEMYLNREPRFYANLGITGGYWRSHGTRISTMFYAGTPANPMSGTPGNPMPGTEGRRFAAGIGIQKLVHPESGMGDDGRWIKTPFPIIRMADLYLMRAEAWNEYEGPSPKVYADINLVRRRAGIDDVETTWNNAAVARTVGKHARQDGLREIILQERGVELAFEGQHFWDMYRHKRAHTEFSVPIMGWNNQGTGATFFQLAPKQMRSFSSRDYLWPIATTEMNTNANLIQNPGW
ncbi:RagB/SusD domain-containing protein [Candidatus Symbiothrix dinenymphae]|nr:RagB/SusD domain-containing protein [Candidatus Symbiothrix dinenymphae]